MILLTSPEQFTTRVVTEESLTRFCKAAMAISGYNLAKSKLELDKSRDELVDTFVEALTNLF